LVHGTAPAPSDQTADRLSGPPVCPIYPDRQETTEKHPGYGKNLKMPNTGLSFRLACRHDIRCATNDLRPRTARRRATSDPGRIRRTLESPRATQRQPAANGRNAREHATGPRTTIGRMVASRNSLKDGFAGEGKILPPALAALVEERKADWAAD